MIVYIRSLPPVRNELPQISIPFPLSFFVKNVPQPVTAPVLGHPAGVDMRLEVPAVCAEARACAAKSAAMRSDAASSARTTRRTGTLRKRRRRLMQPRLSRLRLIAAPPP